MARERVTSPQQRSLGLGDELADAADRVRRAVKLDVDESRYGLERLSEKLQRDPAQVSRMLDGKGANPSWDLIAWAVENGPNHHALAVLNEIGHCVAPRPKPPALPAHWFAAQNEVLDEMGIAEVVRDRARQKLPKFQSADDVP